MNTSSYSPIASDTYDRWKVEFVLKTKMTKTAIQRRLWRNSIQRDLSTFTLGKTRKKRRTVYHYPPD